MYSNHRKIAFHGSKSGSGSQKEPDAQTKDLMEKLSFLNEKMSHRTPTSTVNKSKGKNSKMWNSVNSILDEKKKEGFIVSDRDKFVRSKKKNGDEDFKLQMSDLVSTVKDCASAFASNMKARRNVFSEEQTYNSYNLRFTKYFKIVNDEESRDSLMKLLLCIIKKHKET